MSVPLDQFLQLLQQTLAPQTDVLKAATDSVAELKKTNPEGLVVVLLQVLATPQEQSLRQQAAVLLRQTFRVYASEEAVWGRLSQQVKDGAKVELLKLLQGEQVNAVRKAVCDATSTLGATLLDPEQKETWPELMPALFAMISGTDAVQQDTSLRVLRWIILAQGTVGAELMKSYNAEIVKVAHQCMLSASPPQVRSSAALFVLAFPATQEAAHWKPMVPLFPEVLQCLADFVEGKHDEEQLHLLEAIAELVEEEGMFFKKDLDKVIQLMLKVATCRDTCEDTQRQLAFEIIVSLAERRTKACRKLPGFVQHVVELCFNFMVQLEDDRDWEKKATAGEDDNVNDYDVGEENIDRLAKALPEETLGVVFAQVQQCLQQPTWQYRHAAMMAISQVVEMMEGEESHLKEVVDLLNQQCKDPHPRVRYAALQALGQAATDQSPDLQLLHHQIILPLLQSAMEDPVARVAGHACSAFINYAEDLGADVLLPVTEALINKLFTMVSTSPSQHVKEQAITSIAVIAGVIEERFVPYYPHIVPVVKQIIVNCTGPNEKQLRGKAFECVSLIGLSVGKATAAADGAEIMTAMLHTLAAGLEADDPQKSFIYEAIQRVCRLLEADFAQFVTDVVTYVFRVLSVQAEEVKESTGDDMNVFTQGNKLVGLRTSTLDDMGDVLDLLVTVVKVLGANFTPFVKDVAQQVLPFLSFKVGDSVRSGAVSVWTNITCSATTSGDTQLATGLVQEFLKVALPAIENEMEVELCTLFAEGVCNVVSEGGQSTLSAPEVTEVVRQTMHFLAESFNRRAAVAAGLKEADNDEDDEEQIECAKEAEELFRVKLSEILGGLMKTHPDIFVQSGLEQTVALIIKLAHKNCGTSDRALAMYMADDILEQLGARGVQTWPSFMEQMLECVVHEKSPALRQAASYGLVHAAKLPQFAQFAAIAAQQCAAAIDKPLSKKEAGRGAMDNALAAVGSLLENQLEPLAQHSGALAQLWLKHLPLKEDEEEAQKVHLQLMRMVDGQSAPVLGANQENLPRIVAIMADVYRSSLASDPLNAAIRVFFTRLGKPWFVNIASSLTQKQMTNVERVAEDTAAGK